LDGRVGRTSASQANRARDSSIARFSTCASVGSAGGNVSVQSSSMSW
jgi:hypothetical protein